MQLYFIYDRSYGKFSGKIPNFSLPWQQGSSEQSLIANSVLKIANFRCHDNQSMSEPNVTGIVELADPENHTIEPKLRLPYMQLKLWQIF